MTLTFFLGLATTMTILGAGVSSVGQLFVGNVSILSFIGGIIIIIFGILSFFGKGFTGVQFQDSPGRTVLGSYIYGATFAIGWTACVGPILGAILTLLVSLPTVTLCTLKSLHTTEMISGVLLIGIGLLLLTGKLTEITQLASNSSISTWVVAMDEKLHTLFGLR